MNIYLPDELKSRAEKHLGKANLARGVRAIIENKLDELDTVKRT